MPDPPDTEAFPAGVPDISRRCPPLPWWLACRVIRPGERITWVWGPKLSPSWERYVTHPGLFLIALALGAVCLAVGWRLPETDFDPRMAAALAAGGLVFGSVFVLAAACGYFTRLVVTDRRLVIVQGYEVCRSWDLEHLPPSLVRYAGRGGEKQAPTVDLDVLKTMLGEASDTFAEAKSIRALGKQLGRITTRKTQ
jgi:hypothetical protein